MSDIVFYIAFLVIGMISAFAGYLWGQSRAFKRQLEKYKSRFEVKYFESLEDHSAVIPNSRKFVVRSQVYVDGLPVGGSQIVSEHIIEEFTYEKLSHLRSEIIAPAVKAASDLAGSTAGGAALGPAVLSMASQALSSKNSRAS